MSIGLFQNLVWVWIAVAIITFFILLRITAPYGRHSSPHWGPMIDNKLGWLIMEVPSLLLFAFFIWSGRGLQWDVTGFISILFMSHYVYRSILFPIFISTRNKKMPLVITGSAIFFNLINGSINGYWLGHLSTPFTASWLTDIRFLIGLMLFITGFTIHLYHDLKIIQLRKTSQNEYVMPQGGLFHYVSCPNYFGEIVEWLGFAFMCWSLASFSFLIWTCANLIPRAIKNHQWNQNRFAEFPKNRKVLIPGIF